MKRRFYCVRRTSRRSAIALLIPALAFSGLSLAGGSGCMLGARPPRALGAYESITYYQDGLLLPRSETPDFGRDVKRISTTDEFIQLTDYPKGYAITVPRGMEFDFSCSPDFTRIYGEDLEIRIGRDSSPYLDVTGWLNSLPNEFIADEGYRKANDISVNEDGWTEVGGRDTRIFSLTRTPRPESEVAHNSYTYAYIKTGGLTYYTVHFRYDSFERNKDRIREILNSLVFFAPQGAAAYNLDFKPVLPNWNDETAALYEALRTGDTILWGFFTPNPFTPEGKAKIKEVEEKLEYEFPVIMWYRYLGHEFPIDGMLEAYESGKIVEMTLQVAGDMYGRNPNFEVLDGRLEEDIRKFARGAREFDKPFLMRLNNEMNSTWVSYSGHLCLNDPDIFKAVWRKVYDIFQEEGVDNAIWIWNPNDVSYPPCRWNSHVAYYPGNEYVQMIGLTGYNTGDYFRDVTGERWRSFTEIYDRLWDMYKDIYAEFPWIITEFACSSVGGDKKAWIEEMFNTISKYTNIKIAVWWSYYDPDPREATYGTPARRYWLDEKPEYLEAFKKGLERTAKSP
jgi:mannan endo-1,4-beta-mannosidase